MRAKKIAYPDLDHKDMANLFAFLYTARYVDEPGDERRGERLFASKGCVRCHGQQGTDTELLRRTGPHRDRRDRWTKGSRYGGPCRR